MNIVNMSAGMHWVLGPKSYTTNELPLDGDIVIYFFSPPLGRSDLQKKVKVNFGRAATALRVAMHRTLEARGDESVEAVRRIEYLDQVLSSFSDSLEPLAKKALREWIGLELDA